MPIDPSIVSALAPAQGQAASLGTFAQMQTAAEAMRKAADEKRKEQEIRSILSSGDYDRAIDTLNQRGYVDYATKVRQQLDAHRKSVDDTFLNDLKKDEAQTALLTKVAQGVRDQATLETARSIFSQFSEEGQKLAGLLPETWDDAASSKMQQFVDMGLTAEQHSKRQQESYEKLMSGDWDRGTAELLATADTPEEAQGVLAALEARRAPKVLIDRFAPLVASWSPETKQRVADMALTEKDRREFAAKEATAQASAANTAADNARADAGLAETRQHNRAMEGQAAATNARLAQAAAGGSNEPVVAVVDPVTGKAVYVPRSQAAGKMPASSISGSGGRGVTSGDSQEIGEIDSGLDQLVELDKQLSTSGATGVVSWLESKMPDAFTNLTGGIGAQTKSRLGTIYLVKQIIGKGLEGGVLRKEDESKYAKILPTISDPDSVVKTKIAGLKQALTNKKARKLDALEDAGYDVTRFRQRAANQTAGVDVTDPNGKVHHFDTQEKADAFKRLAGIK